MQRIQDTYTDLPVSRQRKWALRNPEKAAEANKRYKQSDKGKAAARRRRNEK